MTTPPDPGARFRCGRAWSARLRCDGVWRACFRRNAVWSVRFGVGVRRRRARSRCGSRCGRAVRGAVRFRGVCSRAVVPPDAGGADRRCLALQPVADPVCNGCGKDDTQFGHPVSQVADAHAPLRGGPCVSRGHPDRLHALGQLPSKGASTSGGVALGPRQHDLLPAAAGVVVVDHGSGVEYRVHVAHADASGFKGIDRRRELLGEGVRLAELLLHGEVMCVCHRRDLESDRSERKFALPRNPRPGSRHPFDRDRHDRGATTHQVRLHASQLERRHVDVTDELSEVLVFVGVGAHGV